MNDEEKREVLQALRQVLEADGPQRLYSAGKGRAGLVDRKGRGRQVADLCLAGDVPLLRVAHLEPAGKSRVVHPFVSITAEGVALLIRESPSAQWADLLASAPPEIQAAVSTTILERHHHELDELQAQSAALQARRERIAELATELVARLSAAIAEDERALSARAESVRRTRTVLAEALLAPLVAEEASLARDQDHLAAEGAGVRAQLERFATPAADRAGERERALEGPVPPEPRASDAPAATAVATVKLLEPADVEDEAYERTVNGFLVECWRSASSTDAKAGFERALGNLGAVPAGQRGERVGFDARWQHTEDELDPGDPAVVVEPGWRIERRSKRYLLSKAVVRAATPND